MTDTEPSLAMGRELPQSGPIRIGAWLVDGRNNELRRDGQSVRLEPKSMEVLVHLALDAGKAVSREELLSKVWPGVVVGDDVLTQSIIKLRKALGDDAHRPTYIETISKRGYRLIAPVEGVAASPGAAPRRGPGMRWAVAAVALVVVVAAAIPLVSKSVRMPWPLGADTRGGIQATMPVVAILPLANLSGDPKREYFSDGVTEDLIGALGRFSGVRVMSRNAVAPFKGKSVPPQAVRDELGATYIVRGSLREADGKLRIAMEMSDADRGVLIWSERYDAEGAQLFEVQDRIARNIVATLHVKLTEAERQRVFTKPAGDLEAYDLVLRARALNDPPERRANREARELLARALKAAPNYPEALTALGELEINRARFGWVEDPHEAAARAEELAKRTLASTDERAHPRAHTLLAAIYGYRDSAAWAEKALLHTERALELNPSDSEALYRRGEALLRAGRVDEAIRPLEAARRLEPQAVRIYLVSAYFHAGRYRDSLALAESLLPRAPEHVALNAMRAANLVELGQVEEARRAAAQVKRFSPNFQVEIWGNQPALPESTARLRAHLRTAGL